MRTGYRGALIQPQFCKFALFGGSAEKKCIYIYVKFLLLQHFPFYISISYIHRSNHGLRTYPIMFSVDFHS